MSKRSDQQPGLFGPEPDVAPERDRPRDPAVDRPVEWPIDTPVDRAAPPLSADAPPHRGEAVDADAAARAFATDPRHNVVLEASAGTGKTSVLVQRYLNLLGAGVDPVNILAMTFTRKAAAEMRERIIAALRAAAQTSDTGRKRWLALRDRVGDIAISTIDAFCYGLLREFPLEAGLDPGFRVAEEAETARLVDEALDLALRACRRVARDDAQVALVLARLAPGRLRDGLAHLLDRRLVVRAALDRYLRGAPADLDVDRVCARAADGLRQALHSVSGGLPAFLADGPVAHPRFALLSSDLRALDRGAVADAAALGAIVDEARAYFLTQEGKPCVRAHGYKQHDAVSAEAWRRHVKALAGVAPAVQSALAASARDLNVLLARGVSRVFAITLTQYRRTMAEHDVLDFPELVDRAADLLRQMDEFSQSRFRLESRYHHVLVDEFQDTSRRQWDLVALLVQSWGEGFGLVHDAPLPPSLFIVGDRKQSIYRFRDANVALLDEAAATIEGLRPTGAVRRYISRSFRALPALLAFVNDVCREVAQPSDRADAFTYGEHDHFPIVEVPAAESIRETPLGLITGSDVEACAELVADEIARLLTAGTVRDRETGVPRAAAPGDIAVLFRSRESHREFERALAARGVATYVYKGLGFYDSDEIKDCVALIRFLAAPESELRAAAFLRSRLVRLSDAALKTLAGGLSAALTAEAPPEAIEVLDAEDRAVLLQARASTASWLDLVDRWRPAEVLDHVLAASAYAQELAGPRAAQARENVKKLRALIRRIDNRGYGTMARLAAHIDRLSVGDEANAVLEARDAVNLMTVHASKGLEFPVVFLVNIGRGVARRKPAVRVRTDPATDTAWVAVDAFQSEADALEPGGEREETKRLLYVALTRARDRLYLSASLKDGELKAGPGSLGSVLPPSLIAMFGRTAGLSDGEHLTWSGQVRPHVLRVSHEAGGAGSLPTTGRAEALGAPAAMVPAVAEPLGDDHVPPPLDRAVPWPRVAASARVADGESPSGVTGDAEDSDGAARLVGRLVHRLFQAQAHRPFATSADAAAASAGLLRAEERTEIADVDAVCARAVALFERFRVQPVLIDALASGIPAFEVPVSFVDRATRTVVRAVFDCLVTRPDGALLLIELKTGRSRPRDRAQLEAYLSALRALDPARDATGLLVYA